MRPAEHSTERLPVPPGSWGRTDSLIHLLPVAPFVRHEVVIEVPDDCDVVGAGGTDAVEVYDSDYVLAAARGSP